MHRAQQRDLWTARLAGTSAVLCTEKHFSQPETRRREFLSTLKKLYVPSQEDSLPRDPHGG